MIKPFSDNQLVLDLFLASLGIKSSLSLFKIIIKKGLKFYKRF